QSHPPRRMIGPAAVALLVAPPHADAVASALHPAMPDDLGELLAVVDQTSSWYTMSLIGLLASGLLVGLSVVLGRLVRRGSPILGTIGLVVTFAGGILMASMQGFKLFLPTLARLAPADGAAAIDAFTAGGSFAPIIGGFVLRAAGLVLLAIAATRSGVVRWPVSFLVAAGAVLAFQLPAGPDAVGWLLVAAGTACIARSAWGTSSVGRSGVTVDPDRHHGELDRIASTEVA
ncbi:MAG: hypothetical protein M3450_11430, partial [Actinomycetota bacterium]|nr:hypothetical protein [Actinomycetota bacterium]